MSANPRHASGPAPRKAAITDREFAETLASLTSEQFADFLRRIASDPKLQRKEVSA